MQTLNIPINLLENNKTNKQRKELLAFAIGIKCLYSNSVFTNVSVKKVMRLFHVSNAKANNLIKEAKQSELFYFDEKHNLIKVISFKDKNLKRAKNGLMYKSDYCYKLEKKDFSIRELTKLITEILIKNAINAVDRNNFPQSNKINCCVRTLTQAKLANISGISRSQVSRITSKMAKSETISKTSSHMNCVISCVNKESISDWQTKTGKKNFIINPKDNTGWIIVPCTYSIKDRKETQRFQNVIYTHKHRLEAFNNSENDYFTRMEH